MLFPCRFQVMVEKDSLIQEAAGENNGLKEQLRSLLVQTDDLCAEKAKLSAHLHGYREQLKQVLSMKDSQHKQQLAAQRERLRAVEEERGELERQLASVGAAREARAEREPLSQAAAAGAEEEEVGYAPGAEVEKLREQLQAARLQVEALEESLQTEREQRRSKSKELAHLQWEGGVMRTESETAQERVAELARDLLALEQKLVREQEAGSRLRAEKLAFTGAMGSLQESRDQAVDKVRELTLKVEELSKAGGHATQSPSAGPAGEVWGLKNALQALQNDRDRLVSPERVLTLTLARGAPPSRRASLRPQLEQIRAQTSQLSQQKAELSQLGAGELVRLGQQLSEEKSKNESMLGVITQLERSVETGRQEVETLR